MPEVSPITNRWGEATSIAVETDHYLVFRSYEGSAYNHHPQIASLDGVLYATWSCGDMYEDDVGQRMVMSTSSDEGESWTEPRSIVPRQGGELADAVITSMGIRVYEEALVAYYGYYEYTSEGLAPDGHRLLAGKGEAPLDVSWHQSTHAAALYSKDGGKTWSKPKPILDRFVPNLSPRPTIGGRLIMPGNLWFPYTDDPSGLSGWKIAGLPRLPANYVDDPEGFHKGCRCRGDPHGYCEGSFFQTDDGFLHMMLRTTGQQYRLAVSISRDNGETWSEPMMTKYTDCECRHQFGRLPDGRFFGLSCPAPRSQRTPMVLATSCDGVVLDEHYILGAEPARPRRLKGSGAGRYGYPYCHIVGDTMFTIYSISKEDIAVCRLSLASLTTR